MSPEKSKIIKDYRGYIGSIYFIRLHQFVKIGIARNVETRIKSLQTGTPYELEIIRIIQNCTHHDEYWLHNRYTLSHIRGEWFSFQDEMYTINPPRMRQPAVIFIKEKPKPVKIIRKKRTLQELSENGRDILNEIEEIGKLIFET
jgi:hypothetical protein